MEWKFAFRFVIGTHPGKPQQRTAYRPMLTSRVALHRNAFWRIESGFIKRKEAFDRALREIKSMRSGIFRIEWASKWRIPANKNRIFCIGQPVQIIAKFPCIQPQVFRSFEYGAFFPGRWIDRNYAHRSLASGFSKSFADLRCFRWTAFFVLAPDCITISGDWFSIGCASQTQLK